MFITELDKYYYYLANYTIRCRSATDPLGLLTLESDFSPRTCGPRVRCSPLGLLIAGPDIPYLWPNTPKFEENHFSFICRYQFTITLKPTIHDATLLHATFACNKVACDKVTYTVQQCCMQHIVCNTFHAILIYVQLCCMKTILF